MSGSNTDKDICCLACGFYWFAEPLQSNSGKVSKLTAASFPIPFNSSLINHPSLDAVWCNTSPKNVKRTPSNPPQLMQYESLPPLRKGHDVIQLGNFCRMSNSKTLRIMCPSVPALSGLPLLLKEKIADKASHYDSCAYWVPQITCFSKLDSTLPAVQVTKNTYIKQNSIHLQVLFRRGLDVNFRHHTETRTQKTNATKFYENLQWGCVIFK